MIVKQKIEADIWADDRLGFADIGQSFTNIIQTIDDSKVISIEAPFGYGKTFFRERWAEQLRAEGELVIEIDALQSDHSGDPLVTFVGALLSAQPRSGEPIKQSTKEKWQKWGGILSRATLKAFLREGAEEVINAGAEWAKGETPDLDGIDQAIDALKNGLSSAAAQMIATHLAAEEARKIELPAQIDALRDTLTEGLKHKRIVIIVDKLDRCHPEYAISLLEAMKLVFGRDGFVFILMVNPNYLEDVAKHRFGFKAEDELYLEKFIDLRFKLPITKGGLGAYAGEMTRNILLKIPYGKEDIFGVEAAAELATQICSQGRFSVRQIRGAILRVDLVTRCYQRKAIDLPLLVALALCSLDKTEQIHVNAFLPRARLTKKFGEESLARVDRVEGVRRAKNIDQIRAMLPNFSQDLYELDDTIYALPTGQRAQDVPKWELMVRYLAPHYIPSHQAMLDGVARLQAD